MAIRPKRIPRDQGPHSRYHQEFHTILAALRFYQERGQGEPDKRSVSIEDLATNGGQVTALDTEAIDRLCERINTTTRLFVATRTANVPSD